MDSKFFRKYVDIINEAMDRFGIGEETVTFPFKSADDIIAKISQGNFDTRYIGNLEDEDEWEGKPVRVLCNLKGSRGSTMLKSEEFYQDTDQENAYAAIRAGVSGSAIRPKNVTVTYEHDGTALTGTLTIDLRN